MVLGSPDMEEIIAKINELILRIKSFEERLNKLETIIDTEKKIEEIQKQARDLDRLKKPIIIPEKPPETPAIINEKLKTFGRFSDRQPKPEKHKKEVEKHGYKRK